MRNFLTTLLLSTGVPMLWMGDEFARTQQGNNNAYCQDNELSWVDWTTDDPYAAGLSELVSRLIAIRRAHPVFRQRAFFQGRPVDGHAVKDLAWFTAEGVEMGAADWSAPTARTLGMYLSGGGIRTRGPRGERITDESFLLLLHSGDTDTEFRLPGPPWAEGYDVELDTSCATAATSAAVRVGAGDAVPLIARSATLLRVT